MHEAAGVALGVGLGVMLAGVEDGVGVPAALKDDDVDGTEALDED